MLSDDVGKTVSGLGVAYAQTSEEAKTLTLEKPFEPRDIGEWNAVDWAESITSILGTLILIIVIFTLIFGRRLPLPVTKYLRFVGLCALPIFLLLFGFFATFEGSKSVAFCASCHMSMGSYANDMKDRDSETLAALHYKNRYIQEAQCYSCHINYGVFGTMQGKLTGLKHFYYWATNSPTARGEKQIKLYEVYQNDLCLRCHAGSSIFLKADKEVHIDIAEGLLGKDEDGEPMIHCLDCHGPVHPSLSSKKT